MYVLRVNHKLSDEVLCRNLKSKCLFNLGDCCFLYVDHCDPRSNYPPNVRYLIYEQTPGKRKKKPLYNFTSWHVSRYYYYYYY